MTHLTIHIGRMIQTLNGPTAACARSDEAADGRDLRQLHDLSGSCGCDSQHGVRGAPAIGVAAMGIALGVQKSKAESGRVEARI